jgi:hypothetical protein
MGEVYGEMLGIYLLQAEPFPVDEIHRMIATSVVGARVALYTLFYVSIESDNMHVELAPFADTVKSFVQMAPELPECDRITISHLVGELPRQGLATREEVRGWLESMLHSCDPKMFRAREWIEREISNQAIY